MEKTHTEAAQLLQKISKGAAMRRDWEKLCLASSEEESQVRVLARIFRKEASEVKEEQPKHEKVIETNHDEEASIQSATKDDPEKKGRTICTAKWIGYQLTSKDCSTKQDRIQISEEWRR